MKGSAVKWNLDLPVLSVLAGGPLHGYAVIAQLETRSGESFDLPEGRIYPVLHRLGKQGLLASAWSETAGRQRRTYTLTKAGMGRSSSSGGRGRLSPMRSGRCLGVRRGPPISDL